MIPGETPETAAGTVALGLAGYLDSLLPGLPPRAVAVGAIVVFTCSTTSACGGRAG
ncbi:MAG: hypothetical protein ACREM1_06110 [Longimicrobiales bacterium]